LGHNLLLSLAAVKSLPPGRGLSAMALPVKNGPLIDGGTALEAIAAACEAVEADTKREIATRQGNHATAEMHGELADAARGRSRRALFRIMMGKRGI
jgi:hypothetical protein